MTENYKDTVFLPATEFPLRAGLAQKEPEILARWQSLGLEQKLRAANAGAKPFILHDGPPYANGEMHLGHALNRVLKDVINRSQRMQGRHVHFVPGWDCHGLPIEWRIEQQYRAQGKNKDEVPVLDLIAECRAFASHWVEAQRTAIKRLGVDAEWDNPYLTMARESEAIILGELHRFLMDGLLYRADRPVMWSVIEQTALAEAEIEYHDHKSTTLWVRFPVRHSPLTILKDAQVVIWTTTPWTLPANQAIAYGAEHDYAVYEVRAVEAESKAVVGEKLVLAVALAEAVQKAARISELREIASFRGDQLAGTVCAHPLSGQGYDEDRPLWAGEFVTIDTGTGFVHIAPSHGEDDFRLGRAMGAGLVHRVGPDGVYYDHVPLFAGKRVLTPEGKEGDANGAVISAIAKAGGLLAKASLTHSYPHSWRSKAPVIFRTTPQWFVALDQPVKQLGGQTIRQRALDEINKVNWFPAQGRNRIYAMVEGRPDWCLSRQRVWGVPIALFVRKTDGQPLCDAAVNARIQTAVRTEGIEAWRKYPASHFLGPDHDPADYEQIFDIADVWFDSACTHAFVLEQRPHLSWPADLYLEGSDQHRGWFHSSLLEAVGTRGHAPYRNVLTHGFLIDEKGYKMSKSLGNGVDPADVIKDFGADVLRLMLINCDYTGDINVGPNIIKQQAEQYRRLRNTLRYLLGALAGFSPAERLPVGQMPELERWVLHRLASLNQRLQGYCAGYELNRYFRDIHDFCAGDLSAFYFDIRKDSLYCDAATNTTRRATRTVMEQLLLCLTAWLAPVLVFTAEEAWQEWRRLSGGEGEESVHLRRYPELPADWYDEALAERWAKLREIRSVVTGALEKARENKTIGSSLQGRPVLYLKSADLVAGVDLAELAITSSLSLGSGAPPAGAFRLAEVADVAVVVEVAAGTKCERCWKILPEVGQSAAHPGLCLRCEQVIAASTGGAVV